MQCYPIKSNQNDNGRKSIKYCKDTIYKYICFVNHSLFYRCFAGRFNKYQHNVLEHIINNLNIVLPLTIYFILYISLSHSKYTYSIRKCKCNKTILYNTHWNKIIPMTLHHYSHSFYSAVYTEPGGRGQRQLPQIQHDWFAFCSCGAMSSEETSEEMSRFTELYCCQAFSERLKWAPECLTVFIAGDDRERVLKTHRRRTWCFMEKINVPHISLSWQYQVYICTFCHLGRHAKFTVQLPITSALLPKNQLWHVAHKSLEVNDEWNGCINVHYFGVFLC